MATTYSWQINQLDTAPQLDGLSDVVVTVHWTRIASDGKYSASSYGAMGCQTPSDTDFTAYPDLTQEQVESWLDEGLDVAAIDAGLDVQIENLINPPIIILPLPWAEPTV
jgi:hypothetical protein